MRTFPCQKVISLLLAATPTPSVSAPSEPVPAGRRWSSESARAGTRRSSSPGMVFAPDRSRIAIRYESVATMRNEPSTARDEHTCEQGAAVVVRRSTHHLPYCLGQGRLR